MICGEAKNLCRLYRFLRRDALSFFRFARLVPSRFFVGVPPLISGKQGMRENGFSKETSYEVFTREWLYDSIRKSGTPACLSGERAEANLVYERVDPKWFG